MLDQCAAYAGINTRSDVIAMGIDKYNEECRSIVMRYVAWSPAQACCVMRGTIRLFSLQV